MFALVNVAFLGIDIYLAHSENSFLRPAEYVPLVFSLTAPAALIVALLAREWWHRLLLWRVLGFIVGGTSLAIGLAGVIYHLDSQFFYETTLLSLTYAAPFVAPLAYSGVGLVLILNRMVDEGSLEWAQWLLLLTLGGFFGNFVLSLTDHAANGFFRAAEWIPVASSAFAVSFLALPMFTRVTRRYLAACAAVLLVQAVVGILGFVLHAAADWEGPSRSLFVNVVNGAPPFAPLLLPNLALLGWPALWALAQRMDAVPETRA